MSGALAVDQRASGDPLALPVPEPGAPARSGPPIRKDPYALDGQGSLPQEARDHAEQLGSRFADDSSLTWVPQAARPEPAAKQANAELIDADAIQRTSAMLACVRLGRDNKQGILNALRGVLDLDRMKVIFEERTGEELEEWLRKQLGDKIGDDQTTQADKSKNEKEAEALLSPNKEAALDRAIENCGKNDEAKLINILASLDNDPALLRRARIKWYELHEEHLKDALEDHPAQAAMLLENGGTAAARTEAKGHLLCDENKDGDAATVERLLRSATNPQERERMVFICAQRMSKDGIVKDQQHAMRIFVEKLDCESSEKKLLMALARGDEIEAAAASLALGLETKNFERINSSLELGPDPDEPGIANEEKLRRLDQRRAKVMQVEAAWARDNPEKEAGVPPQDQLTAAFMKVAKKSDCPELEHQRFASTRQWGGMSYEFEVRYAVKKGDHERLRAMMAGLDREGVEILDRYLSATCGEGLEDAIARSKASGVEKKQLLLAAKHGDEPSTDEDKIAKMEGIRANEKDAALSFVSHGLSKHDERMDTTLDTVAGLKEKLESGEELNAEEKARLDRMLKYMEDDADAFRGDKGLVAKRLKQLARLAAAGAGLGLAWASGGTLAPALAPLLSLGGSAAAIAADKLTLGGDMDHRQLKRDIMLGLAKAPIALVASQLPLDLHGVPATINGAVGNVGQSLAERAMEGPSNEAAGLEPGKGGWAAAGCNGGLEAFAGFSLGELTDAFDVNEEVAEALGNQFGNATSETKDELVDRMSKPDGDADDEQLSRKLASQGS